MTVLSYTDFLNEATQETIKNLMDKKQYYSEVLIKIKKLNMDSSEKIARLKEREASSKNALTKKIYQERIAEESMKQQNYGTRLKSAEERISIIEKQLNIAKLRIQSQTQKKIKR